MGFFKSKKDKPAKVTASSGKKSAGVNRQASHYSELVTSKQKSGKFDDVYITHKLLGSGAFADVFSCTHKKSDAKFAVKKIKKKVNLPGANSHTKYTDTFESELRINTMLNHKHIVNLIEVYELPKLCLVFDFCESGDLFDQIEKMTKYTEANAASYIQQMCTALAYMHEKGVVHRDLKPENLLLAKDPEDPSSNIIKIGDFGLSVEVDDKGFTQGTAGSPDYIAPEILAKKQYTTKVDAWSTGIILFILIAGYPPFENREEIRAGKVIFYFEDWENTSEEVRMLIVKLLCLNMNKRLSCKQILEDAWVVKHTGVTPPEDLMDMSRAKANIKKFNAKRKFKGAVKSVMASNAMYKLLGRGSISQTSPPPAYSSSNQKNFIGNSYVSRQNNKTMNESIFEQQDSE